MIIIAESAAYDQLNYGGCSKYQMTAFCVLKYLILSPVCGLKKNKRPKEDPSSSSRMKRSPKEQKKGGKRKKKSSGKSNSLKGKRKQNKNPKKTFKKTRKLKQTEVEDLSDVRTGLIWPWIASITVSGEVTCTGYIISSRIVITVTRCFKSLDSNRW